MGQGVKMWASEYCIEGHHPLIHEFWGGWGVTDEMFAVCGPLLYLQEDFCWTIQPNLYPSAADAKMLLAGYLKENGLS